MANYNKKISETCVRLGEVRFGYLHVFEPRRNEDGTEGKYSMQVLIPKTDTTALSMVEEAVNTAKQAGVTTKWNGRMPAASKLTLPLRDGDEEFPDDPVYAGKMFFNASTGASRRPGVCVLSNGIITEAFGSEDVYSGCWGAVTVNFYPYNSNGNMGVAAGLNNLIKTRDDERLSGGRTAEQDFGDLSDIDALS